MEIKKDGIVFTVVSEKPVVDPDDVHLFSEVRNWPTDLPEELIFSVKMNGETLGWISLNRIRWISRSAYLTFSLNRSWRGKGYGTKMVRSFLNVYFHDLGFHRITAEVYDYNTRSKKLLERLGFVEEGRLRKARFWNGGFHDIIVYGLLAEDFFEGKG